MGSKGSQTSTSSSSATQSADPQAAAYYRDVLSRAQAASQQGYTPYTGQQVAGFSPDQLAAMQGVAGVQGTYAPMLQQAAQYAGAAGQPINAAQINAAMSPYIQGVIDPTLNIMSQQQAQEMSKLRGTEAQQGAFGGTRSAVAEANLANQQLNAKNQMVASLMQQGYSQAVAQAQADRQAAMQGAGVAANVAGAQVQTPLQALGAQLQTGALQQQLQQAQLNVPYQQFLQAQAYPYQQLSWASGIGAGLGPLLGGTSTSEGTTTTTPAQPSLGGQIFGGLMSLAALPMTGGASLGGTALAALSDERAKENIEPVGKLKNGLTVYKYNYKGDPLTQIGLIAQDVEKKNPEAVGSYHGLKTVNYDEATKKADGGAVGGDGIDIESAMAHALQLADAEMSQQQPAPRAYGGAADGGAAEIVNGALNLAQAMKRGMGGAADHMADGGVPGATLGTIDVGGRKIIDIFPSKMGGSGRLSVSGPGFVSNPMQKQPDYSDITKGLGAAFKFPTSTSNSGGASLGSPGNSMTSGIMPFSGSAGDPTGGGEVLTAAAFGGAIHKEDGGSATDQPVPFDAQENAASIQPIAQPLAREARALSNIESGGRYDIVGPEANKAGNRAYGKYQVMDFNVGPWTSKYYGQELTPQEFLANKEAQEAVFKGEFGRLSQKYGPEGASRAWFAGEGGMNQPDRRDVLGTSVADYSRKFKAGLGEPTGGEEGQPLAFSGQPSMADSEGQRAISGLAQPYSAETIPTTAQPAQYQAPNPQQIAKAERATSIFEKLTGMELSPEARMGLMAMGLKMMTTPGSIGTAIGAGGLQGLATYTEAQRYGQEQALKQQELALRERQRVMEERKPQKLGERIDRYGVKVDVYGMWDPVKKEYVEVQGGGIKVPEIDYSKSGQELLKQVNKEDHATIKQLSDYQIPITTVRPDRRQYFLGLAQAYDPTYDPFEFQNRRREMDYFTGNGMGAKSLQAFNTAVSHMNTLEDIADNLNNRNSQTWNLIANKFQQEFGATAPNSFDAVKQIVADEIMKSIVPGGGGVGERQELAERIKSSNTPEQMKDVLKQFRNLMGGQLDSLERRYIAGTKKQDFEDRFLGADAKEVLKKTKAHEQELREKRAKKDEAAPPAGGTSEKKSAEKRFNELKAGGMPTDQIYRQLKKEGY